MYEPNDVDKTYPKIYGNQSKSPPITTIQTKQSEILEYVMIGKLRYKELNVRNDS